MPNLLTPTEPRVPPVTLYGSPADLPRMVAAHCEKHRRLVRGVGHYVELHAGDPVRGRIHQQGLPQPLCFTLRKDPS